MDYEGIRVGNQQSPENSISSQQKKLSGEVEALQAAVRKVPSCSLQTEISSLQ